MLDVLRASAYGNTALRKHQASRCSRGKMGALTVLEHALESAWS